MSTEKEAAGATVTLNTPGTPGPWKMQGHYYSEGAERDEEFHRPGLRVSSADEGETCGEVRVSDPESCGRQRECT